MPEDTSLSALPEAIPLRSVSPMWRILAIVAIITSAALALLVAVLGMAALSEPTFSSASVQIASPVPPPWPGPGSVGMGGAILSNDPVEPAPGEDPPTEDPRTAPYPLRADLAQAERSTRPPRDTSARQFLRLGQEVWRGRKNLEPEFITVSPEGRYVATVHGGKLLMGTLTEGLTLVLGGDELEPVYAPQSGPAPGTVDFGLPMRPSEPAPPEAITPAPFLGVPTWVKDLPVVCVATGTGRLRSCRLESAPRGILAESLPLAGEAVTPVTGRPDTFIVIRARTVPRVDVPGEESFADPTEVVLCDVARKTERVLVPASQTAWKYPAVSPDGARLALVANEGHEPGAAGRWRIFVLDLAGGVPRPESAAAPEMGPVAWTPDSKGLVYARSQLPIPADHWEEEPARHAPHSDLCHRDLTTGTETRLTRGGGFFSPSVDTNGTLYYLTSRGDGPTPMLSLRSMPLLAALTFGKQPQLPPRTAAVWGNLAQAVLNDAEVKVDAEVATETFTKAAAAFARRYEEMFGRKAPASLDELDNQRRELESLAFPRELHPRIRLVIGIAEGEFLRQHHGARWRLAKGPLVATEPMQETARATSPFGAVHNPFQLELGTANSTVPSRSPSDKRSPRYEEILRAAEGRPLILSNERTGGAAWIAELADPELARGTDLLKQDRGAEGERVLLAMMQQQAHRENAHLALHVGKLLYTYQRFDALVDLMKRQARKPALAAQKYNLLGLTQLRTNPQEAIGSFRTALRHDLQLGAAYLNLAQAYQKTNNLPAAAQCLRRCLHLQPNGPYARDAQRRLGELQASLMEPMGTAGGPVGPDGQQP